MVDVEILPGLVVRAPVSGSFVPKPESCTSSAARRFASSSEIFFSTSVVTFSFSFPNSSAA